MRSTLSFFFVPGRETHGFPERRSVMWRSCLCRGFRIPLCEIPVGTCACRRNKGFLEPKRDKARVHLRYFNVSSKYFVEMEKMLWFAR